MKLKEIIIDGSDFALILNDSEKEYEFCTSYEYARNKVRDYIFLGLFENGEDIFEELQRHLSLRYCKGFIINKEIFNTKDGRDKYHKILKGFSSSIEALILVKNIYNNALIAARYNTRKYSPKTFCITGSDEREVLCEMLYEILSRKGKTLRSLNVCGAWQKFLEPLLALDESTEYCVINIDCAKNNISKTAANILTSNSVIFSKTSFNLTKKYKDKEGYIDEIMNILCCAKNIDEVFTYEENDIINSNLPQQENLNIVYEYMIKQDTAPVSKNEKEISYKDLIRFKTKNYAPYFPRCAVMSALCAKKAGIDKKTIAKVLKDFREEYPLVIEKKLENNCYSCICTEEHTHYSIIKGLKYFCEKYRNFKKIIVLSAIPQLEQYSAEIHNDIIELMAREAFDTAVLIDMEDFSPYYRKLDKFVQIKNISSNDGFLSENKLIEMGLFLKGKIDKDTAIFVFMQKSLSPEFLF